MVYLALQTMPFMALTAAAFFGLGIMFTRLFGRSKVSEEDSVTEELVKRVETENQAQGQLIQDLRTRLIEKERDIAELLDCVSPAPDAPSPLVADPDPTPEPEALAWEAEIQALREELEGVRAERQTVVERCDELQTRLENLQEQLNEKDYALQLAREATKLASEAASQEDPLTEDLNRAVEAIWEDEDIELDPAVEEVGPGVSAELVSQFEALRNQNERMQEQFLEKIQGLEATLEDLKADNEMALIAAVELAKPAPVDKSGSQLWSARAATSMTSLDPSAPDDLALIKGIGPVIRRMLSEEFGIHTFLQLAELTPEKIAAISQKLYFKGRIERENWVGQARALHAQKYPSATWGQAG